VREMLRQQGKKVTQGDGSAPRSHARAMDRTARLSSPRRDRVRRPVRARAGARRSYGFYNDPLVFGMTPDQVERAVQAPLVYSRVHAVPSASSSNACRACPHLPRSTPHHAAIPPRRLTGWRRDWQMPAGTGGERSERGTGRRVSVLFHLRADMPLENASARSG